MAKLYCDIETNRTRSRRSHVHRLGDHWVLARVQNWDHQIEIDLYQDGQCSVVVRELHGGKSNVLYVGSIAEALELPKVVAVNQPTKVTAIELDVQQFLKESA